MEDREAPVRDRVARKLLEQLYVALAVAHPDLFAVIVRSIRTEFENADPKAAEHEVLAQALEALTRIRETMERLH